MPIIYISHILVTLRSSFHNVALIGVWLRLRPVNKQMHFKLTFSVNPICPAFINTTFLVATATKPFVLHQKAMSPCSAVTHYDTHMTLTPTYSPHLQANILIV